MTQIETPSSVLIAALHARDALDFETVVRLCDPLTVSEFFREYCAAVAPPASNLTGDPSHPIAEDSASQLSATVGVSTYQELTALDPSQFGRRWLERRETRWNAIARLRARNEAIPDELLHVPANLRYEVIRVEEQRQNTVRAHYQPVWTTAGGQTRGGEEYEELSLLPEAEWRLIFRVRLLQPRGAIREIMSRAIADAFRDET